MQCRPYEFLNLLVPLLENLSLSLSLSLSQQLCGWQFGFILFIVVLLLNIFHLSLIAAISAECLNAKCVQNSYPKIHGLALLTLHNIGLFICLG